MSTWRHLLHENFDEVEHFADAEQAYRLITTKCQPWLSEAGIDNVVWRGISREAVVRNGSGMVQEVRVRKDRKPRDTSKRLHAIFNDRIRHEGCIANRSNSLFVTGEARTARNYGVAHAVFPVGEFNYTWSPIVKDAAIASEIIRYAEYDDRVFQGDNGSLIKAIKSKHEIMIACDSAILINEDIWDHVQEMLRDS